MNQLFTINIKNTVRFSEDESGAVTVDWVVLTAALVGIGVAVISTINAGIEDAATDIRNELSSAIGN